MSVKVILVLGVIFALGNSKVLISKYDSGENFLTSEAAVEDGNFINFRSAEKYGDYRRYVAGQRVNGDSIVAQTSKNQKYSSPQNVNVTLRYPGSGYGKLVTYVEILVNQTSTYGNANILAGGVHQHFVQILIQAFNTYQMDYSALFFGL